jgi:tripartite-type tricarboxylate transporter receptor subunit TctC
MLVHSMRRRAAALAAGALAAAGLAACGSATDETSSGKATGSYPKGRLSIMAPADPGGGWDETARALQDTVRKDKLAKGVEVYNVPGAGGTIGLSRLASKRAGDPNQLMVMGLVMVGAIEQNKAPTNLSKVTPIASLTSEPEVIVVPANSKFRTLEQLVDEFKADPAKISFAGGSAGGADHLLTGLLAKSWACRDRRSSTSPTRAEGRPRPRSSRAASTPASRACPSSPTRSRPARCACSPCPAAGRSRSAARRLARSRTRASTSR